MSLQRFVELVAPADHSGISGRRLFGQPRIQRWVRTPVVCVYLSAETAASFTGRVIGLYAVTGAVTFRDYRYTGWED